MTLSPPVSRAAAVALLVAVIGLIVFAGVAPLLAYSNRLNAELDETHGLIARFGAIAAAREAYEQQSDAFDAAEIEATVYLPGTSPGMAAASLQELVGQVADDQGADLKSTQALPGETEGEHERARIRVVLECTAAILAQLLVELESHVPLVFVSNLDIEPRQGRRGEEVTTEPALLARFDLYGYRKEFAE
jgi:hypothetical protein